MPPELKQDRFMTMTLANLRGSKVKGPARNGEFSKVARQLFDQGYGLEIMEQLIAAHPGGESRTYLESLVLAAFKGAQVAAEKASIDHLPDPETASKPPDQKSSKPASNVVALSKQLPRVPDWRERNGSGPKGSLWNAQQGLIAVGSIFRYDEFHKVTTLEGHELFGEVNDSKVSMIRDAFSVKFGFDPGKDFLNDAIETLSYRNRFNPVVEMLAEAQKNWDGKKRLDRFAADYLNAEDTELNSVTLRKHLIAGVQRARRPGTKYDIMVVLESPEGFAKGEVIKALAGEGNFCNAPLLGSKGKETIELLSGVWHFECAELSGIKSSEVETIKSFITQEEDKARMAYGRRVSKHPRQAILWGSTNESTYLKGDTGHRRFRPVRILKEMDPELVRRDRLQLWGEAATYEAEGESNIMPRHLWDIARDEVEIRRLSHPWEDQLANIPSNLIEMDSTHERIDTASILWNVLGIPVAKQSRFDCVNVATFMQRLGWERCRLKQRQGYRRLIRRPAR